MEIKYKSIPKIRFKTHGVLKGPEKYKYMAIYSSKGKNKLIIPVKKYFATYKEADAFFMKNHDVVFYRINKDAKTSAAEFVKWLKKIWTTVGVNK